MRKLYKVLFFFLLPTLGFSQSVQLANFGGTERSGAISLSLGNYGYVGLGSNGTTRFSDFWKYDPTDDSWTKLTDFPGESRDYAVAFAVGEDIYVGSGSKYAGGTTYYADFYKYSPLENVWTLIAPYGGGNRGSAVAFVIDGFAYVGTGSSADGEKKDFWKYNPADNTWVQVADAPDAKTSASGFAINGKGYLVAGVSYNFGSESFSDVQEYNPVNNTWKERIFADGMNLSFTDAAAFVLNDIAYIAYGNKDYVTTYNPITNKVNKLGDLIGIGKARFSPCSFVIDEVAYFGLGSWTEGFTSFYANDFWKYTAPLPTPQVLPLTGGGSYCKGTEPTGVSAYIENPQKKIQYQLKKDGSDFGSPVLGTGETISWANLEKGSYKATATNGTDVVAMNGTVVVKEIEYVDATIEISTDKLTIPKEQSATITTSITNGGNNPSFSWLVNDVVQGELSGTMVYNPNDKDAVKCILTSDLLCVNTNPITSNELVFAVSGGTSAEVNYLKHFSVYPNPVQSKLTIEMHNGVRIDAVKIISLDGKELLRLDAFNSNFAKPIDVSHLSKGIYILQIQGEKGITSVRIVKE